MMFSAVLDCRVAEWEASCDFIENGNKHSTGSSQRKVMNVRCAVEAIEDSSTLIGVGN